MNTLADIYLPEFHFSEHHECVVNCASEKIAPLVVELDFSGSWIIRMLFALRGMPAHTMTLKGLNGSQFITLTKNPHEVCAWIDWAVLATRRQFAADYASSV